MEVERRRGFKEHLTKCGWRDVRTANFQKGNGVQSILLDGQRRTPSAALSGASGVTGGAERSRFLPGTFSMGARRPSPSTPPFAPTELPEGTVATWPPERGSPGGSSNRCCQ